MIFTAMHRLQTYISYVVIGRGRFELILYSSLGDFQANLTIAWLVKLPLDGCH